MNVEIKKRIAALENKVAVPQVPEFIHIRFDYINNDFLIKESYMKPNKNGKRIKWFPKNATKEKHLKHYKEYIFAPEFKGLIFVDLMDCPKEYEFDLMSITGDEIRKKAHVKKENPFSLSVEGGVLVVTEYE